MIKLQLQAYIILTSEGMILRKISQDLFVRVKTEERVTEFLLNIAKLRYELHQAYRPCVPWETEKKAMV